VIDKYVILKFQKSEYLSKETFLQSNLANVSSFTIITAVRKEAIYRIKRATYL